jgi:hypothetical protein
MVAKSIQSRQNALKQVQRNVPTPTSGQHTSTGQTSFVCHSNGFEITPQPVNNAVLGAFAD